MMAIGPDAEPWLTAADRLPEPAAQARESPTLVPPNHPGRGQCHPFEDTLAHAEDRASFGPGGLGEDGADGGGRLRRALRDGG